MCLQHWSWGHLLNGKILLSWVFIILGGSAQGGRRRRGEWVGGRVGGCGVARAGRSLWAKSLSGRGPSALLLPQRAPLFSCILVTYIWDVFAFLLAL